MKKLFKKAKKDISKYLFWLFYNISYLFNFVFVKSLQNRGLSNNPNKSVSTLIIYLEFFVSYMLKN